MSSCRYGPHSTAGTLAAQSDSVYFSPSSTPSLHTPPDSVPFVAPYCSPGDMGHLAPSPNTTLLRDPPRKRRSSKSSYKHIPHREKSPHLVARRNARERRRVQAVNNAFVRLRRHVPHENRHKRLSKVKTLRIAIEYINYLQSMIADYDAKCTTVNPGEGRHAGQSRTIDMVELTSNAKENRWIPCNLHGGQDSVREMYLSDAYQQYHQG